jgi:hypothetical protein
VSDTRTGHDGTTSAEAGKQREDHLEYAVIAHFAQPQSMPIHTNSGVKIVVTHTAVDGLPATLLACELFLGFPLFCSYFDYCTKKAGSFVSYLPRTSAGAIYFRSQSLAGYEPAQYTPSPGNCGYCGPGNHAAGYALYAFEASSDTVFFNVFERDMSNYTRRWHLLSLVAILTGLIFGASGTEYALRRRTDLELFAGSVYQVVEDHGTTMKNFFFPCTPYQ